VIETGLAELGLKGKVKQINERLYSSDLAVDSSGTIGKVVIDFDQSGYLLDAIGSGPFTKDFYTYEKNRKIEKTYIRKRVNTTTIYLYDDKGRVVEMDRILGSDTALKSKIFKTRYKTIYKYDARGNKVEEDTDDPMPDVPIKTVMTYNNNNEKIESDRYLSNGNLSEKTFYQYDNFGNEIKYENYDAAGKLKLEHTTSDSNFDEQGNWLLQVNISKNHPLVKNDSPYKFIIKRNILYYK
jgi:antitoxin component YwqK of YwqJK toxin-antitoxin module